MYRTDIQGMRALAVTVVVLYHAGVPYLGGGFVGVDLFFVVSGFLITGLLLAEVQEHGRVSLANFWARRARRILPASTLVLAATAVLSAFLAPLLQRPAITVDLVWSALFSANWRFAQERTNYLAQERDESPVLHYWSLGVEEQFYVVWPLVVAGVVWFFARNTIRGTARPALGVITTVVIAASLSYEVALTATNQPYAYFGTPARAWQLGVGALLAIGLPLIRRIGKVAAELMAVAGLAGFAWSVVSLSETGSATPYPGLLAVVPTAGAALLVAAGCGSHQSLIGRALSIRPFQILGDLSFSWYLWHFPFLVLGAADPGSESPQRTTLLVLGSLAASWLTFRYVEAPIRRLPRLVVSSRRSLQLGGVLVVSTMVVAMGSPFLGARPATVVTGLDGRQVALRPAPAAAADDVISMRDLGCDLDFEEIEPPSCEFGDLSATREVILLGDSHAAMMFPPLERVAKKHGWRLTAWMKSACPVADVTKHDTSRLRAFDECDQFRERILDRIVEADPDVVFAASAVNGRRQVYDRTTGELLDADASYDVIQAGLRSSVERLTDAGIKVVMMVDPAIAPFHPVECLADKAVVAECQFRWPVPRGSERQALAGTPGVEFFDFTHQICDRKTCTPVRDDLLIYRDRAHITKVYAMTLVGRLARKLEDAAVKP